MGIPENIDALLVEHDITAESLARIAGVAPSTVARWRKGSQIRPKNLERICSFFDLEPDDLLSTKAGFAAKAHDIDYHFVIIDKTDLDELKRIYESISDEGRKQLMTYARGIAATYPKDEDAGE